MLKFWRDGNITNFDLDLFDHFADKLRNDIKIIACHFTGEPLFEIAIEYVLHIIETKIFVY